MTDNQNALSQGKWCAESTTLTLPAQLGIESLPQIIKQNNWLKLPVSRVDFSQVKKADSAILSVLLWWAQQNNEALEVLAVPEKIKTLIDLYDMHEVMHFQN